MALETVWDWDAVIATFEHPRYEMYGTGTVFDGEAAVRGYFAASRTPFPDQGNEVIAIAHARRHGAGRVLADRDAPGAVEPGRRTVVEPTGKAFRVRMAASFEFPPLGEKIICERPYFDQGSVLRALGIAP